MRPALLLALVLALACIAAASKPGLADPRPNLILLLADDLGYGEANQHAPQWGFPFNPLSKNPAVVARPLDPQRTISTPHLARLAQMGMRGFFSYSPSSECAPSRASIMLGRHVGTISIRGDCETQNGLDLNINEPGFVNALSDAGYSTALVGKWGIGSTSGAPWLHGFQYFYGQLEMQEAWAMYPSFIYEFDARVNDPSLPASNFRKTLSRNVANSVRISEQFCAVNQGPCDHSNDLFANAALNFVYAHNSSDSTPFFLWWAPTVPHLGTYQPGTVLTSPVKRLGNRTGTMTQCRRGHAAGIEQHFDRDVGLLLNALASTPRLENTLLVVSSDNGPHGACQDDSTYSPSWFVSTGGLQGLKATMYEGGLRVPTFFYWPGQIAPASTLLLPHTLADLSHTFVQIAGATWTQKGTGPLGAPGGGQSILQQLLNPSAPLTTRTWLHFELCVNNSPNQCARTTINLNTWNKIVILPGVSYQMYNLLSDPMELTDISGFQPTALQQLLLLDNNVREPLSGTWRSTWTPSRSPSNAPTSTSSPTFSPSRQPTAQKTGSPSLPNTVVGQTTQRPSRSTKRPTLRPTRHPTHLPTVRPTKFPTPFPTPYPSEQPSRKPTKMPTTTFSPTVPFVLETHSPFAEPTAQPSIVVSTASPVKSTKRPSLPPLSQAPTSFPTTPPALQASLPPLAPQPTSVPFSVTASPSLSLSTAPTLKAQSRTRSPETRRSTIVPTVFPTLSFSVGPSASPEQSNASSPVEDKAIGNVRVSIPCSSNAECTAGGPLLVCFLPSQLAWLRAASNSTADQGYCECSRFFSLGPDSTGVCQVRQPVFYIDGVLFSFLALGAGCGVVQWTKAKSAWPRLPWWTATSALQLSSGLLLLCLFSLYLMELVCILGAYATTTQTGQCAAQPGILGIALVGYISLVVSSAHVWQLLRLRHERSLTVAVVGVGSGLACALWVSAYALADKSLLLVASCLSALLLLHAAWAAAPSVSRWLVLCTACLLGTFSMDLLSVIVLLATTGGSETFEPGDFNRPGHFLEQCAQLALLASALMLIKVVDIIPPCKESFSSWALPNQTISAGVVNGDDGAPSSPSKPPRGGSKAYASAGFRPPPPPPRNPARNVDPAKQLRYVFYEEDDFDASRV